MKSLPSPDPRDGRRLLSGCAIAATIAVLGMAGCSGTQEESTDVGAFCAQASANQALIVDPPLGDAAQIEATMKFYKLMGELAPVEISDDWLQLSELLSTANDLVPGDDASEQLVAVNAYAAEAAAYNIAVWVERNCGVTLPITTIVSHTIPPAQPPLDTYVPPATTAEASVPESTDTPSSTSPTAASTTPTAASTTPIAGSGASTATPTTTSASG